MKVGIVVYPGSNCDRDTLQYFTDAHFIWHKSDKLFQSIDLLVIPGGFAFEIGIIKMQQENTLYHQGKWLWSHL